jgi:hypothetical protein
MRWLGSVFALGMLACAGPRVPRPEGEATVWLDAGDAPALPAMASSDAGSAATAKPAVAASDAGSGAPAFVRTAPSHSDAAGVDACAYLGGAGYACLNALVAEKDPVHRRYMRRLSDADAVDTFKQRWHEPSHAEIAMDCNDSGPCGKKTQSGIPGDWGYACLTRAEWERENAELTKTGQISPPSKNPAADAAAALARSRRAHERACHCDPEKAQIPVAGGSLACDGKDKPVERGGNLSPEEADEIRACAICDPEKGPPACAREIERLATADPALAHYLRAVHVPRCQRP